MSSGSSRCTGPNRSCCASRNASRTIEGMVAALTICRAILVSGAMVETMSTTWNSACLWLKIPFWPVIITIGMAPSSAKAAPVAAFRQGLAEADFVENRNVAFEFRWAEGQFERLPGLAADLADRKVAIIAAFGNNAARAAKVATKTIPVAFASSSDPVTVGLVTSLTRPGANVTGVSILNQELESTRLERLVQVVPHATTIAFLVNPKSLTADPKLREMENTARMFNPRLQVLNARSESEFESIFATVEQQQIGAMVVTSDTMFSNESA